MRSRASQIRFAPAPSALASAQKRTRAVGRRNGRMTLIAVIGMMIVLAIACVELVIAAR